MRETNALKREIHRPDHACRRVVRIQCCRTRKFKLEPAPDEQDYQAVFAYQGAMAYVYLADAQPPPPKVCAENARSPRRYSRPGPPPSAERSVCRRMSVSARNCAAPASQGITVAKGAWSYDKSFVVQFGELGGDNMQRAILSFEGKGVDVVFAAESGPGAKLHGEAVD